MSDYPKGLRFDIYERFTLSDEVAGISELEDIELTPRITMQTHEEQAVLSGDLLLTGTYVGVGEQAGTKQLSHQIPVEITLPLKRIKRMDHIGIEIENFDVELLSNRSLNITGVICLNGIDTSAEQAWQQQGEATFVHEVENETSESASATERTEEQETAAAEEETERLEQADADATDQAEINVGAEDIAFEARDDDVTDGQDHVVESAPILNIRATEEDEAAEVSVRASEQSEAVSFSGMLGAEQGDNGDVLDLRYDESERVEPLQAAPEKKQEPLISPAASPQPIAKKTAAEMNEQPDIEENLELETMSNEQKTIEAASVNEPLEANVEPLFDQERIEGNELIEQEQFEANEPLIELTAQSETKEMKIAFGSNKQDTDDWSGSAAGVKSLLQQAADQSQQQEHKREEERAAEADNPENAKSLEESVKWKNLLLSAEQDEQRFSKMRMCIVQKEETLEGIAMRYSLNPKEIVLYNRLESEQVHEGQVIYIPR